MKTFDDFLREYAPMFESVNHDLAQFIRSSAKENATLTDSVILAVQISQLYTDKVLRLYHEWLHNEQA